MELNKFYNCDCMEYMKTVPDKYFELAIVDPPYGIERFKNNQPTRLNKYGNMNLVNDEKPNKKYFNELYRISDNQIIFGYNHLSNLLPTTKEFIFWWKHQPVETYSDGELLWTSFNKTAKCFDYPYYGSINADINRFHPTQKPIALYRWVLQNYAKLGDKIFDSHGGSGSLIIACIEEGYDYVVCEIDKTYYDKTKKRIEEFKKRHQREIFKRKGGKIK